MNDADDNLRNQLHDIIARRQLSALFQPIVHLQSGAIIAYEGLIRGPSDSPLHSPLNLFKAARACNLTVEVEHLCRRVVLERFAELALPGKLFLNVSPECLLLQRDGARGETLQYIHQIGINPERVIIELTENQPTYDYELMREAVMHYRNMGFRIAIDDLGEGFSSLRLWSELRPEYVKIDMHFIQGINQDPVKLQFVRSIQEIADQSDTLVIAEGIETQAELLVLRDLGVAYGQGYHLGRPHGTPAKALPAEVAKALSRNGVAVYPQRSTEQNNVSIQKLLHEVATVSSSMNNNDVYDIFMRDPKLMIIPVVDDGVPLGLISRFEMIDHFARPYQRELYGRKSCRQFMDAKPLVADISTGLQELSFRMAASDAHHLFNGFIITEQGRYAGMGTGHDLMREITQMQINAARYANPLTQLPGNVPINEHIDRLLESGARFWVCYCDLDHFKPFNDVYGYRRGDDIIQMTGRVLAAHCDPDRDFIGHIGGDDFMILFQSEDWEARCRAVLDEFGANVLEYYSLEDRERGGYISEDRQGKKVFYSLMSLSLGTIRVEPQQYYSHHQIAALATDAKKQAKKIHGNSLFIDRRQAG
ncbi:GGDEF domain-containing protein [Pseudoduganella namucuonensis]|uniref:Diguanylate cyclase (GGDEF) domain-containing protein n=1 Tax=Pseudoduganella namucuonensis TaxID=1035707 RepID=A0A1I7HA36_9BURK|nr:GGDEF domain-containing protein [Pseudoduganella namucuonensis]SFU57563.1 diguanylate cyclase (GGDEF) domain-containing protein [Pseudoduganella namucuonensis]